MMEVLNVAFRGVCSSYHSARLSQMRRGFHGTMPWTAKGGRGGVGGRLIRAMSGLMCQEFIGDKTQALCLALLWHLTQSVAFAGKLIIWRCVVDTSEVQSCEPVRLAGPSNVIFRGVTRSIESGDGSILAIGVFETTEAYRVPSFWTSLRQS